MKPLEALLSATTDLVHANQSLHEFCSWPDDLRLTDKPALYLTALDHIRRDFCDVPLPDKHSKFLDAFRCADTDMNWQQTYTEQEVGLDFLNRYAHCELIEPKGHFYSTTNRVFIAYWGAGLFYPWHNHLAEELYFVIAGSAKFHTPNSERILQAGGVQFHESNQPHAMTTDPQGDGILTLVMWRGAGLDGVARLSNPC